MHIERGEGEEERETRVHLDYRWKKYKTFNNPLLFCARSEILYAHARSFVFQAYITSRPPPSRSSLSFNRTKSRAPICFQYGRAKMTRARRSRKEFALYIIRIHTLAS